VRSDFVVVHRRALIRHFVEESDCLKSVPRRAKRIGPGEDEPLQHRRGTERVRLLVKYERRNRRSDRPQALQRSTVYNSRREDRRRSGLAPVACVGGRLEMLCSPLDS
jgi:hypothetical protein